MSRVRSSVSIAAIALLALLALSGVGVLSCRNMSRFSTTAEDHFEGAIVRGDFTRTGFDENSSLCLTFDSDRIADGPGTFTSSDGLFRNAALRSIPPIWHDPLSTLNFGQARVQNLIYVSADTGSKDAFVILSLMQSGSVEARILRGAPRPALPDGGTATVDSADLFGVFLLDRKVGPCSF